MHHALKPDRFVAWRDRLMEGAALLTLSALPIGTGPTSLFSVLFLAIWLFGMAWRKDTDWWRQQKGWLLPVAAVFVLPWLSLLWSINPEPKLYPFLQRTHFWLLAGAAACLAFRMVKTEHLAYALIAGVELNVLLFLPVKLGMMEPHQTVHAFMIRGYITYSLLLVLATLLLSFWFRAAQTRHIRFSILAAIALNLFCIASLFGRSGHLAIVLLSPVLGYNLLYERSKWLVPLVSMLIAAGMLLSPTVQQRIQIVKYDMSVYKNITTDEALKTSAGARMTFWKGGLQIFRERPLLGAGIDGYPVAMKKLYPESGNAFTNPHNFYIYLAATYGAAGLCLYGWLWIAVFRRAWPCRDQWGGFFALSSLAVISIGSLTDITPLSPPTGILLAMMAGLPMLRNE